MASDFSKLQRLARKAGWMVEPGRRGKRNPHVRFIAPDGTVVIADSTASDHRSIKNTAARLRAAGLPVPHKGGHLPRERNQ